MNSKEQALKDVHIQWRNNLTKISWIVLFIILIAESCASFVLYITGSIDQSPPIYWLFYIILPIGLILFTFVVSYIVMKRAEISDHIKNAVPILVLCSCGGIIVCIHSYYSAVPAVFVIPILLTIAYGSREFSRKIMLLCWILIACGALLSYLTHNVRDISYSLSFVIATLIFVVSCFITSYLIEYQNSIQEILVSNYEEHQNLKEQLMRDPLTNLYNHSAFYTLLNKHILDCRVKQVPLTIALLDIDKFKSVNDLYGHARGNIVLETLARVLQSNSVNALAARYGGDEFTVIFPGISYADAFETMEQLRKQFGSITFAELDNKHVTFSCGVAELADGMSEKELFDAADCAVYHAKKKSVNGVLNSREGACPL